MKILALTFSIIFVYSLCFASEFVRKETIDIDYQFNLSRAEIIGKEPSKDSCFGEMDYFTYKRPYLEIEKFREKILGTFFIIDSQSDLLNVKHNLSSRILNNITINDLKDNRFAFTIIRYVGLQFINNERLSNVKGKNIFEFEIWENESDMPIPHCIWEKLYILKLPLNSK